MLQNAKKRSKPNVTHFQIECLPLSLSEQNRVQPRAGGPISELGGGCTVGWSLAVN